MGLFSWLFGSSVSRQRVLRTGRFGADRHKPRGEWVQTTTVVAVVGIQYRRSEVTKFCRAVQAAERSKKVHYGVRLRPEPTNPHDANAIAVDGVVENQRWHVGYLDRDTADELNRDLISMGVPIAAELYNLWVGDDGYADIKIIILAPPGYGMKTRLKAGS